MVGVKLKSIQMVKIVENIEDLFFEYLRVAEEIKPKVIIGENVVGLSQAIKLKLNEIVNTFEKIGYDVSYKILDASKYGVPQSRRRVIFIAVREDVTRGNRIIIYEYCWYFSNRE